MSSIRQLTLGLSYRKAFNRDDFLIAPCNQQAVSWLDAYAHWSSHALMILGPAGSGKTHLSHIFSHRIWQAPDLEDIVLPENVKRIVVENIDTLQNEQSLFHLFNWTKERGIGLLMTAREMPTFELPDLVSRMALVSKVSILPPDDDLMYAVLVKAFAERHIAVEPAVLEYAVKRIERSFPAVRRLIEEADKLSLQTGRRITIPIVKEVLKEG